MTLNGVMAVTLHYFTDFGKPAFQHNHVDLWWNLCTNLLTVFKLSVLISLSQVSISHLLPH